MMHTHGAHAPDPHSIVHRAITAPPPAPGWGELAAPSPARARGGWPTAAALAAIVALLSVYVWATRAAPTPQATHIARSAPR